MKIIFFGTPQFAVDILNNLVSLNHEVIAVVSKPDKPKGRSRKLLPTPVKQKALDLGLTLYQPEKASCDEFETELKRLGADLFFVVGYGEIMRQSLLDIPAKGCVNVHTSLLPRWRGAAPVRRAMMAGDLNIGATLMYMSLGLDEGDIICQRGFPVDMSWNFQEVMEKVEGSVMAMLPEALHLIENEGVSRTAQDHNLACYAHKILEKDCYLNFYAPVCSQQRLIQSLSPDLGALCALNVDGQIKRFKFWNASVYEADADILELGLFPGSFAWNGKCLLVRFADGILSVDSVQMEGKKRMDAKSFFNGMRSKELGSELHSYLE